MGGLKHSSYILIQHFVKSFCLLRRPNSIIHFSYSYSLVRELKFNNNMESCIVHTRFIYTEKPSGKTVNIQIKIMAGGTYFEYCAYHEGK